MRKAVHTTALLVIVALLVVLFGGTQLISSYSESDSLLTGPYIDEVIFKVIVDPGQTVLALQTGEIEMDTGFIHPNYLPQLDTDPNIDIYRSTRNGYGHITINCRKYPLNISGFRRAFAFAFNKTRVSSVIFDGFSIEHDSMVPQPNSWCAEDQFDYHYYTAQPDIGNQILDDLGFAIDGETGYRNAPDGIPFEIVIEHGSPGPDRISTPDIAVEALHSLHIDAHRQPADWNEYISRLDNHGDYDMVFFASNFFDNDIDWLAYEYWSEYVDTPYQNPTNFRNATYDSYRDALLYGTTYEEVYEAGAEMQKILHYNVPRLVVYENVYLQAYRNDQFTGHVEDLGNHISGPWTMRNIHNIDGTFGGTVPIAIGQEPDSFNIYVTNSAYAAAINSELWSSLYKYNPDLEPWPDLAESMLTETHSDNPSIPEGNTRFTIDIIRNATWSDGEPVTAEDVAFTFVYGLETGNYTDMHDRDLSDLEALYCPAPYRVVFEFKTESFWHFGRFAYEYIIPQHIFNDVTGIGYDRWNTWNPVFDPAEPNVNCGPFIVTDIEAGEYYKIERNPLFHYAADPNAPIIEPTSTTTSSSTTTSLTNQSTIPEMNGSLVFSITLISGAGIVIVFCLVIIMKERRALNDI